MPRVDAESARCRERNGILCWRFPRDGSLILPAARIHSCPAREPDPPTQERLPSVWCTSAGRQTGRKHARRLNRACDLRMHPFAKAHASKRTCPRMHIHRIAWNLRSHPTCGHPSPSRIPVPCEARRALDVVVSDSHHDVAMNPRIRPTDHPESSRCRRNRGVDRDEERNGRCCTCCMRHHSL